MLKFYLAVVVFFSVTWIFEFIYGAKKKHNTYNGNEFFSNLALGLTSTLTSVCVTLLSVPLYLWLYKNFSAESFKGTSFFHIVFAIIAYDFLYYWNHRWHHTVTFLWLGHSVHHSGQSFNYSTSLRLGIIASLTSWVLFMPLAMLGVSIEAYLGIYAIQLVYQHLIHTQHIPKFSWLEHFFYTPSHHRVHHACNKEYLDKNHGCFFIVFDKLFNTFAEEKTSVPTRYGTTHQVSNHTPSLINVFELKRLFQYLTHPNMSMAKSIHAFFNSPDYESTHSEQTFNPRKMHDYSNHLDFMSVAFFLLGLVGAIYIAITFIENVQELDLVCVLLFLSLAIGLIDLVSSHLNKKTHTGWLAIATTALIFVTLALQCQSYLSNLASFYYYTLMICNLLYLHSKQYKYSKSRDRRYDFL